MLGKGQCARERQRDRIENVQGAVFVGPIFVRPSTAA